MYLQRGLRTVLRTDSGKLVRGPGRDGEGSAGSSALRGQRRRTAEVRPTKIANSVLELVGNTPLVRCDRLAKAVGVPHAPEHPALGIMETLAAQPLWRPRHYLLRLQ